MVTTPQPDPAFDEAAEQASTHQFTVVEADAGTRLDRYLTARLSGHSRSRVQTLIGQGAVTNGQTTIGDAGYRVKPGDEIAITVPPAAPAEPEAEAIALNVVYEDDSLIVIDKPAGLVVHPAAGHETGTLVNALLAHCGESLSGIGGVKRPGIVHRLDKDTSGLLVVAKTDAAHAGLSEQFASHGRDGRLQRQYVALCWGALPARSGTIDAPLGRSPTHRTRMAVMPRALGLDPERSTAREAITHYSVSEVFFGAAAAARVVDAVQAPLASLVEVALETGRTHQIRVHMAHIGHPVMGDGIYGSGFKASERRLSEPALVALHALDRQALHAAVLGFEHPVTGKPLLFESPLPAEMADLITALRPAEAVRKARRRASRP
jgi:23S rRNA pseudouridine1911/1915/1917 synthase